jgi:hypothetical protein
MIPLFLAMAFLPILAEANSSGDEIALVIPLIFGLFMLVLFPYSLALGIVLPAAEIHVIEKNEFAAVFRFREWWPIFRVNWVGFVLAYLIAMMASMVLSMFVSIAVMTIVLFCVLPFIMPAIVAYLNFIMYAAYAQAYKQGKDRLDVTAQPPAASEPPTSTTPTDVTILQ